MCLQRLQNITNHIYYTSKNLNGTNRGDKKATHIHTYIHNSWIFATYCNIFHQVQMKKKML